ncbi:glutamate receptor ionotropic, NMDA 1-like isoform X2 [Physella acuta]|nr:glutamate receptor ionotropic, NMDA 1-like isoform X2 [Physella acuta]
MASLPKYIVLWPIFLLSCLVITVYTSETQYITIGASLSSERMENEFRRAVANLNRHRHLHFNATTILMDSNPIRSALDICDKLLAQHVFTVVASHPNSTDHSPISVSYTCGFYNIPVVGISARDSAFSDMNVHKMFLRTVPPYSHQADVWVEIVSNLTWHKVIFLYSADEEGRAILSRFQTLAEKKNIRIEPSIKYAPGESSYRSVLEPILKCTSRVILFSASAEDAYVIYQDAERLGMTGEDWAWIVSEQAFEVEKIPVGFLGVHLVNGTNEVNHIRDAVEVIGHAFHHLMAAENISNPPTGCNETNSWESGNRVYDALKKTAMLGETGQVSFSEEGDRLNPMYEILNVNGNGMKMSVGLYGHKTEPSWGLRMKLYNLTWPGNTHVKPKGEKISRNLRIVTLKEKPFVEVLPLPKDGHCIPVKPAKHAFPCKNGTQDHCCMGYCMDMLAKISEKVHFNFTIHLSKDGLFGSFEKHNSSEKKYWNGMMGELMRQEADLIVAPLTINPERANDIDFTKPFKYQGLNILVRKTQKDSSLASFLQPFQDTLWILVGLSVHVVALVLYLLDRFSPFGRFKLAKSDDTEEDALNLSSAMWFSWGVLLNSGIGEGTPRSFSARVLGMVWAGFAMIIVASYTANLAAFLVLDRPEALISGIDDPRLRNPNEKFKYATVKGSAVEMYFKRQVELSTMYRNMEGQKKYLTAEAAIEDIRKGELQAFIWDSPRLEYEAASDCDLTTAGDLFGRSGLGIGLPKNSPWTHEVSMAVLDMHESGFMEDLDNRWILVDSKSSCPESNSAPATLGLTNMAGVFMMVAGGIVAGVLLIFIEIAYKRHRGLKEKELELARNAADRWRGNIEKRKKLRQTWQYLHALRDSQELAFKYEENILKRRTLRQTLQKQKEEQMRVNSVHKQPSAKQNPSQPANATSVKLNSNNTKPLVPPPYRRPSLLEATRESDCLPPPLPMDYRTPGYVPARSGRTVTWHNPSHNPSLSPDNLV